jgi:hypothetical protein
VYSQRRYRTGKRVLVALHGTPSLNTSKAMSQHYGLEPEARFVLALARECRAKAGRDRGGETVGATTSRTRRVGTFSLSDIAVLFV